ncbi:ATP-dependent Clp protease adaptor ClpS [Balneolaceae bacterium]|jgi:ATP-dependent Clp protease adapter protein ClpS|nr:ATP-dependent Clp protease adaptor ClpS [Balneolaceae bacterium]|tara:strand:- start:204 stop:530 length:327 start_codon:yes stop_codon:yes gene_type:complete
MYPNVTHTLSFAKEASNEGDLETLAQEEVEEAIQTPWRLILYNDEVHTFEEVIQQLIKALKCGRGRAEELTLKVHSEGKAIVFEGEFEECLKRDYILREIELITEIKG